MKVLIDLGLFQYKCLNIAVDKDFFTYKTHENKAKKIPSQFLNFLSELNNSKDFIKEFMKKKHNHPVKDLYKRSLVLKIFIGCGYKSQFVDQYFGDNPNLWQLRLNSGIRMFCIIENKKDSKEGFVIIKPLFLDVNHIIYNDENFEKRFEFCSACLENTCS